MRRIAAIVAAFAGFYASALRAEYIEFYFTGTTGSTIMQVCPAIWKPGQYDACGSYFIGLVDGLAVSKSFCPPPGVNNMQLSQLGYNAIKDHPEIWDKPAVLIVLNEFQARYPCQKTRKSR